jgi:hypothetical protein
MAWLPFHLSPNTQVGAEGDMMSHSSNIGHIQRITFGHRYDVYFASNL